MTPRDVLVPQATVRSAGGLVCSVDPLASSAAAGVLRSGGTAVDAAIAGNAVLAVTAPQMCGMGGDLFALVHDGSGPPEVCEAVGWAGAGASADELRAGGHTAMPVDGDIRSVTVPGCVDGWLALHSRHGTVPLGELLEPAAAAAEGGFPCSSTLAAMAPMLAGVPGADWLDGARTGRLIRRPGAGRALRAIASDGRDGFYGGEFGAGLVTLGRGLFSPADLSSPVARWREPIGLRVWDVDLWTAPPPSQGYLAVAGAWIAAGLPLPSEPDHPLWAHLLVEAARQAGWDRPDVLHADADGSALLAPSRLGPRRAAIDPSVSSPSVGPVPAGAGDTTYLCVVDASRRGVSLIQSNASGFGSLAVEPSTGINLHGRGLGFSLVSGHPAEYAPGRRPPHTLSPLLATRPGDGSLAAVLGTMGGDAQPQILLQVAARLFAHGWPPGAAVAAGRWWLRSVRSGPGGFDTWTGPPDRHRVVVEGHAPSGWSSGLSARGHSVVPGEPFDHGAGHAHAIVVRDDHVAGAADPRCRTPAAVVA